MEYLRLPLGRFRVFWPTVFSFCRPIWGDYIWRRAGEYKYDTFVADSSDCNRASILKFKDWEHRSLSLKCNTSLRCLSKPPTRKASAWQQLQWVPWNLTGCFLTFSTELQYILVFKLFIACHALSWRSYKSFCTGFTGDVATRFHHCEDYIISRCPDVWRNSDRIKGCCLTTVFRKRGTWASDPPYLQLQK